jgi:hypothetical protein
MTAEPVPGDAVPARGVVFASVSTTLVATGCGAGAGSVAFGSGEAVGLPAGVTVCSVRAGADGGAIAFTVSFGFETDAAMSLLDGTAGADVVVAPVVFATFADASDVCTLVGARRASESGVDPLVAGFWASLSEALPTSPAAAAGIMMSSGGMSRFDRPWSFVATSASTTTATRALPAIRKRRGGVRSAHLRFLQSLGDRRHHRGVVGALRTGRRG